MKPGGKYKHITVKLTPEGARQVLHALGDTIEHLEQPPSLKHFTDFGPRAIGQLRLLALLLERSLRETDQLAQRWPASSGSIYKIQPRKIP